MEELMQERKKKRKRIQKQGKSKLKVKRKRGKYIWELQKESKPKVIDWGRYIKVKVPVSPIKYVGQLFGGGGKKYGFAKMATIKKSNRKHTAHVLRLATERMLADKPAAILNSEGYSFKEAMERIKAMHEKKGQQKNAYLEITCAFQNMGLLQDYVKELSQKFNTETFAVIHTDESVPHCHIVISWCNKQGKAIRLQKRDLWNLWETTIRKLQPNRLVPKQKGEGLKQVPYWAYRKAWLKGQEEYQTFCMEQWEKWKLFYKWLNEYNWEVPPPFRRKFFQEWLEEEQRVDITTAFKLLDTIAIKPQTTEPEREASPPGDVKHADVKHAEGMLIFTSPTTPTPLAPEGDEVVIGGGVDAQALVVPVMENKVASPEDMVVAIEKTEDIKEPVVVATMDEPLEEKEPVVVAKEEGIKLDRKDEVVATKEPLEGKKDKEDRKDEVLAKETENKKITKGIEEWTEDLWTAIKEINKKEKEKKKQLKELEEAIFKSFYKVKTKGRAQKGLK